MSDRIKNGLEILVAGLDTFVVVFLTILSIFTASILMITLFRVYYQLEFWLGT